MRLFALAMLGAVFPLAALGADDALLGFRVEGKAVNPACLFRMKPYVSDKEPVILSIAMDACQKSNWGHYDGEVKLEGNKVEAKVDGALVSYRVLGKTPRGAFVIFQEGDVSLYQLDRQSMRGGLTGEKMKNMLVLSLVGTEFVPCLKKAEVKGDTLVVEKNVYDAKASRAQQCTEQMETVEFPLP